MGKLYNWVNIYNRNEPQRQKSIIYKDFNRKENTPNRQIPKRETLNEKKKGKKSNHIFGLF